MLVSVWYGQPSLHIQISLMGDSQQTRRLAYMLAKCKLVGCHERRSRIIWEMDRYPLASPAVAELSLQHLHFTHKRIFVQVGSP